MLFAVTAEVFTTSVVAPAASVTLPDADELHTAGEAEDEQFPEGLNFVPEYEEFAATAPPAVMLNSDPPPFTRKSAKFPAKPLAAFTPKKVPDVLNVVG